MAWNVWAATSATTLTTGRWGSFAIAANGIVYVIGGCTAGAALTSCSSRTSVIERYKIYNNDSGNPVSWSTANTYSTNPNRVGLSAAILNGYIYAAGGCISTSTYCTDTTNNVSYAAIDTYGDLGTWSSTTANLPADRAWGKLKPAGGTLYYIGGQSDTDTDYRTEVYYGTPSSGNISSWGTASNGLPNARSNFGATVWNDQLYVVGGEGTGTGCSGGVCNTVYVSPSLSSGGNIGSAWSTGSTSFNVARSGTIAVAYANNLYVLGGFDGANYLSDSQYSQIDTANGNVGSWSYSTTLPKPLAQGDGFAANGYMYVLGGQSDGQSCNPISIVAPVSSNTTVESGNNPTGIGAWNETNERYTTGRFGNAAVYHGGKSYVLGGADCISDSEGIFTTPGTVNFDIPAGVTSMDVKMWGGGGGAGGGNASSSGGNGGGGGYVSSTLSVTPGETLTLYVGGGGGGAGAGDGGGGGGGGGWSGIFRSATPLIVAGGGGGGGGALNNTGPVNGGNAGAGGGTSGLTGVASGSNQPGTGGTGAAVGTGGTGLCNGNNGSGRTGGQGVTRSFFTCTTSAGGSAGVNGGGAGSGIGNSFTGQNAASGGGGGGYFGGGSGAAAGNNSNGGGAGSGGGSSYTTGTGPVNTAGSGNTPGNSGDGDRGTAGDGGTGSTNAAGSAGSAGKVIIDLGIAYSSPVVQQSTLRSQPQVAKYSISFDTDSDVFPDTYLFNGFDNGVDASWTFKYRSATDPGKATVGGGPDGRNCSTTETMTNWGQETTVAPLVLGSLGSYTPKNTSGTDTNCARYYFLSVGVDAQETFGFPDDVERVPTITDISLRYTADPAKRLMHGRTFINGMQNPIDTPVYTSNGPPIP